MNLPEPTASPPGRRQTQESNPAPASRRFADLTHWVMPLAAVCLLLMMGLGIAIAKSWPLVHDAALMHYVVFLMDHGKAPYRDILDMNMPGTYVLEGLAVHTLGGDAFGWWLWDMLSGLTAVLSSAWIAGSGRRSAGAAGGALVYLFHLAHGAWDLGQRDWIVAVLLLAAFGCLFKSIRKEEPVWMAGFMGCSGVAASIKPPVLGIAVLFLLAACWLVARQAHAGRPRPGAFLLWALLGGTLPAAMVAIFLLRWGVTHDFLAILRGLVPYYAGLGRLPILTLLEKLLRIKILLAGASLVFVLGRSWRRWESDLLLMAALAGAALFLIQGKGWDYHLYPELAFAFLWATLELDRALKAGRWQCGIASVTLFATLLALVISFRSAERKSIYPTQTLNQLQNDLTVLGGDKLSGHLQCLDMTMGGCINVLYRMHLVQSTGSIYDFYLFPTRNNAVTTSMQTRFLQQMTANPPGLLIISSHTWPGDFYSYQQIENWPVFQSLLMHRYRLVKEFPDPPQSAGYRIYVLNGGN